MMKSQQYFRKWQRCIAQIEPADWFGSIVGKEKIKNSSKEMAKKTEWILKYSVQTKLKQNRIGNNLLNQDFKMQKIEVLVMCYLGNCIK